MSRHHVVLAHDAIVRLCLIATPASCRSGDDAPERESDGRPAMST